MKHSALWNYNIYEVIGGIWKGVMVPGLSCGNAVLCVKSEVQSRLGSRQRSVGRLALGAYGNTTNEGVLEDTSWASFEAREAISKLNVKQILHTIEDTQWLRKLYKNLYMKILNTKWTS
uniref:Putative tick transposon n=1 Tax=Ixodes ricinus TaxID=34613 RepID=A0A6B0UMB6_IXORI